ncbi:MAG: PAS domain-containing protein [Syntrophomonadaceae bacterium]|nr:PAS domain-containing protein [Syntrophomonadaceae bacterium]
MTCILDKLPLGIIVYNQDAELVYCNEAARQMLNSLDEEEECHLDKELRELTQQSLLGSAGESKLVQLRSQGTVYWATATSLETNSPQVMITLRDDTITSRLKQTLLKAESLSVVGQLAVGTLTEMINPLTVVYGLCQLLAQSGGEPREFLELICQELSTMKELLDDFTRTATSYR